MLVDKKFKNGDIIAIKLISGEEVIGRLDSQEDNGSITLSKVGILGPVQTAQGISIAMSPFMFGVDSDNKITFEKDKYIVALKAIKQAADMYTQQTTGIQTASPADLNGIDLNNLGKQ